MVRSASVLARNVPLAFHSDLPMAPAEPLALASFAVNRITETGRVAAPERRIGVHDALRAVTIEAAYSWQLEHELGSVAPGDRIGLRRTLVPGARGPSPRPGRPRTLPRRPPGLERPTGRSPSRRPWLLVRGGTTSRGSLARRRRRAPRHRLTWVSGSTRRYSGPRWFSIPFREHQTVRSPVSRRRWSPTRPRRRRRNCRPSPTPGVGSASSASARCVPRCAKPDVSRRPNERPTHRRRPTRRVSRVAGTTARSLSASLHGTSIR